MLACQCELVELRTESFVNVKAAEAISLVSLGQSDSIRCWPQRFVNSILLHLVSGLYTRLGLSAPAIDF